MNQVVRKSNQLINSRYSLSPLSIKIITKTIAQITKEDNELKTYKIKISDLFDKSNMGSDYQNIISAANELLDKKIEIKNEKEIIVARWISSLKHEKGSGELEIEISNHLKPYLLQLKDNYLNYDLSNILGLKSSYVIRLYELLKAEYNKATTYKTNLVTVVYELNIEDLRHNFNIPDSYKYKDIRINIIDKAVEQFAKYTDIEISYKIGEKEARKVKTIEISIKKNSHSQTFMNSLQDFIKYMRTNFINQDILQQKNLKLSISEKGRLYNKINLNEYNKKDALQAWKILYNLAKEDKLLILKQGKLF